MTALPAGYERRYTTRVAKVAHAVFVLGDYPAARCGQSPAYSFGWLGAGDQAERDRAASLPPCKSCDRFLGVTS